MQVHTAISTLIILIISVAFVHSYKILGVFPFAAYSHYNLGSSLMKELATKGHEVYIISPYEDKHSLKNYNVIYLEGMAEEMEEHKKSMNMFDMPDMPSVLMPIFVGSMGLKHTESTLQHPKVKQLLESDHKFDIVIAEQFLNEAFIGFCDHYRAVCIKLASTGSSLWTNHFVANPMNPAYIPDFTIHDPLSTSLYWRAKNTFLHIYGSLYQYFVSIPSQGKLLQTYFPNAPTIQELNKKVDLILLNSHVSISRAVPHVPNMIEIGGFHIKPPKNNLPKHLKDFLDGAKEGVIYFSMGSNLKSKDMSIENRKAIINTIKKLKLKVLWKFEEDLKDIPDNLMIQSWLPQPEVLAHPNVKLFITHGGLLSTTEAVYHGVPIVGIPIFGDQAMNMMQSEQSGIGLTVKYRNLTEKSLTWAINAVLNNPEFTKNAKELSNVFHDRPIKPMDEAIFWIGYAGRHRGAKHYKTAGVDLSWYQYYLIDVGLLYATIFMLNVMTFKIIINKLCKKKTKSVSRDRKNK